MLDRKFIVENAELVAENCRRRNSKADVAKFVEMELKRRKLQAEVDELNRQANEYSGKIGKAPPDQREALKVAARELREKCSTAQADLATFDAEVDTLQRTIPNLSHPGAP